MAVVLQMTLFRSFNLRAISMNKSHSSSQATAQSPPRHRPLQLRHLLQPHHNPPRGEERPQPSLLTFCVFLATRATPEFARPKWIKTNNWRECCRMNSLARSWPTTQNLRIWHVLVLLEGVQRMLPDVAELENFHREQVPLEAVEQDNPKESKVQKSWPKFRKWERQQNDDFECLQHNLINESLVLRPRIIHQLLDLVGLVVPLELLQKDEDFWMAATAIVMTGWRWRSEERRICRYYHNIRIYGTTNIHLTRTRRERVDCKALENMSS
mmetsp:Transcript_35396/g.52661  ORF Transcript_35396/g.52661 Transcript_35396/m.52661 type:complete len:269 (-) Transcript_35396:11-817(-)